jgi:branched-chain amino acid transport system permease protein
MDITYLLFNTIIYGTLALMFSVFFSSGKIMNFALGNYLIGCCYLLYAFITYGFSWATGAILVGFVAFYVLIHWVLLHFFPHDKQRDLVGLVLTLGASMVLENAINYLYGPSSISLSLPHLPLRLLGVIFLFIVGGSFYFFKKSLGGKMLNAISENSGLVRGLGIQTTLFLQGVFMILLVLLFGIAFLLLTETSLRASDGLFYMIKALGIMVLVGTARKEYLFVGALLYVLVEYLLFIVGGFPISYKETLILVVILGVLLFKSEGLFTGRERRV